MSTGGKICWKQVCVRDLEGGELRMPQRLAALYRFQNGGAPPELCFFDSPEGAALTEPSRVDWGSFPVVLALEAVTREEVQRLRALLDADAGAPAETGGMYWGLDIDLDHTTWPEA